MKCKFCNEEKKLIKAHAIPESFFRPLRDGNTPPKLVTNKTGVYPKKSPIGIYDTTILCRDCEDQFGPWDDYAQLLLLQKFQNADKLKHNGKEVGYKVLSFDYNKLKLFFISVLWRAHASSQPFYSRIKLGPFADIAKDHIINKDPGSPDDFAVILAYFEEPIGMSNFDPFIEKYDGLNYYRFYMAGFCPVIKVDHRIPTDTFRELSIGRTTELFFVKRDFMKSKELSLANKILKANKK